MWRRQRYEFRLNNEYGCNLGRYRQGGQINRPIARQFLLPSGVPPYPSPLGVCSPILSLSKLVPSAAGTVLQISAASTGSSTYYVYTTLLVYDYGTMYPGLNAYMSGPCRRRDNGRCAGGQRTSCSAWNPAVSGGSSDIWTLSL